MGCTTLQILIQTSDTFQNNHPRRLQIVGAPKWIETDQYDIDAKAEGAASVGQMAGPMLRTLLEDRFKLKMHVETRQLPVYFLTVAKSGSKLQPVQPGSCVPIDLSHMTATPPAPGQTPPCGRQMINRNGTDMAMDVSGLSVADFSAQALAGRLDRPVIDKTGLTALFDFHLQFAPDNGAAADSAAPSIFTAVQEQLGLKLSPDTGPVEVLVVDHIEKPSEN